MIYVVIHGLMYLKPDGMDGEMTGIPLPLTPETKKEVDTVWEAWERAGKPYMFYHEVGNEVH